MITLCVHCLNPIKEIRATIFPEDAEAPEPHGREPRSFDLKVQKLYSSFREDTGTTELMLNVVTDEGIAPEDVQAVDQLSCIACGEILDNQVHCCMIRGKEVELDPDEDLDEDLPTGYVLVATMGAASRFDLRSFKEIREAVKGLIEFDTSDQQVSGFDLQEDFEWDH